jgi:PilZ domain
MRWGREREQPHRAVPLPECGALVSLATATGERIPARVVDCDREAVLVAIMVPLDSLAGIALESLLLEFVAPQGRVRLGGTVGVDSPAEPDVLRIAHPRSVEVLQQREFVRVQAARPLLVYTPVDQFEVQSYTIDVSGGGMLLAGPDTLRIGEELRFRLTLEQGEPPVTGSGKVVRIDEQGRRAVAFSELSGADQRRVVRFVFECQRAERRRGLDMGDRYGG